MIDTLQKLKGSVRNLRILEVSAASLRQQLATTNPDLLAVTVKSYERRIASLQRDIAEYLAGHPAEISSILPPIEQSTAVTAPSPVT